MSLSAGGRTTETSALGQRKGHTRIAVTPHSPAICDDTTGAGTKGTTLSELGLAGSSCERGGVGELTSSGERLE